VEPRKEEEEKKENQEGWTVEYLRNTLWKSLYSGFSLWKA
jgi:hypothetical protein